MAILFDRRESQEQCESIARTLQGLPNNSDAFTFEHLVLSAQHITSLLPCCYKDAVGFYFNALVSYAYGLVSITGKHYSWAAVQLYYSVYYACRAMLGFNRHILVRKGNLYELKVYDTEQPRKLRSRNDHKVTIDYFKRVFGNNDYLMSNNIDGIDFYSWITSLREITHYRQKHFKEPNFLNVFTIIERELSSGKRIGDMLDNYSLDWDLYCFQEEFAAIVAPYKLLTETNQAYLAQPERVSVNQRKYVEGMFNGLKWNSVVSILL